ncbi:mevalonate kinase [Phaffia rhodozyma]|uniref:Cystathionine beta-lyase n=1 Tax=Phaffia rhodozyma TaxID=264483 RepID=A0A0F7SJU0_PHARH|nr:mevalonate kinase [Phaffia rhodozyma]
MTDKPDFSFATPPASIADSVSSLPPNRNWRFATECATVENPSLDLKDQHGSSSVPIYQTATFKGMNGQFDYTRSGNPTRSFLEHHLRKISGSATAHAVSSGMAALDVILRVVKPGDTVLAGDDLYGGTNRLLGYIGTDGGVDVQHCDTTNPQALKPHLEKGNKVTMVLLESPTNPMLKIADIRAIVEVVRSGAPDALIVLDNTMMSPYLQRPLELGVDIVYDSGTKYLSGHHDLMAGVITTRTEEIGKRMAWFPNAMGNALSPFDSFLLLRGLKTLPLRLDKQQASSHLIASYLHTLGFLVHYPGLPSDPGYELHNSQASGAGAVMSFETGDIALSEAIVGGTRVWGISVSFGAVNSLISMPCLMSHASIPAHLRAERGLPEHLIRLCVGIEDPHDLLDDLEASLVNAGAIRSVSTSDSSRPLTPPASDSASDIHSNWAVDRARQFERVRPSNSTAGVEGQLAELNVDDAARLAGDESQKEEILVSAPGKVILFGEHAVVHGVTGIAASVDLRCYALLSPTATTTTSSSLSSTNITISLTDLNFTQSWPVDSLPWSLAPDWTEASIPESLCPTLLAEIERIAGQGGNGGEREKVATMAFLYLLVLLSKGKPSEPFELTARSALPMGAGLGSSAALSTSLALVFLLHFSHLSPTTTGRESTIPTADTEVIDKWAFLAEKVIHGNPSGIDNAVSTRGGAVAFKRKIEGKQEGGMEAIKSFTSIRFLITDSRIGRDTRSLVAGVNARLIQEPEVIVPLLEAIQQIADEAIRCLKDSEMERAVMIDRLQNLVSENHAHLAALGVSHPSLEEIIRIGADKPFELRTKLTGAGGGGCAVTLVPDDFSTETLQALMETLVQSSFAPYIARVGGSGVGFLSSTKADPEDGENRLKDGLETVIRTARYLSGFNT